MPALSVAAMTLAFGLLVLPGPPVSRLRPRPPRWRPLLVCACVGVLGSAVGLMLLPVSVISSSLITLAISVIRYRSRRMRRAWRSESVQLAAALEILVGELRVGMHPARAFETAGLETVGKVGNALRSVSARAQLGGDVVGGLIAVAGASSIAPHWHRLATQWRLAYQCGLPIAPLMGAARRDIAERQRFTAQVEADLAGARTTAATLAALPVVGVVLGQMVGAHPIELLTRGATGGWLLNGGVVLAGLGLLWSDRIAEKVHSQDGSK